MLRTLVSITLMGALALAQQKPQPSSRPSASKQGQPPFSARSAASIGNDILQVINALLADGKAKGEYETTAAYEARKDAVSKRFGQLVFMLPRGASEFAYDADTQEMTLHLAAEMDFFDCEKNRGASGCSEESVAALSGFTIDLVSKVLATGSYVGSNAYGAKATIKSTTFGTHGISISNLRQCSPIFDPDTGAANMRFPMGVEQARAGKPFLRALMVGNLSEPIVYRSNFSPTDGPTISMPFELKKKGLYVPFVLKEIQIIDARSKGVMKSIEPCR